MIDIYIDVETSGLYRNKHALLQLSGIIEVDGEQKETFNHFIRPFDNDEIDAKALEVNGIEITDIPSFDPPNLIFARFRNTLAKYIDKFNPENKAFFIAYNAKFDQDFLRTFFTKCGDRYFGSWFFTPYIDVMTLACQALKEERHQMPNFKLGTVAEQLGFKSDDSQLHDAMYDITLTRDIYKQLNNQ